MDWGPEQIGDCNLLLCHAAPAAHIGTAAVAARKQEIDNTMKQSFSTGTGTLTVCGHAKCPPRSCEMMTPRFPPYRESGSLGSEDQRGEAQTHSAVSSNDRPGQWLGRCHRPCRTHGAMIPAGGLHAAPAGSDRRVRGIHFYGEADLPIKPGGSNMEDVAPVHLVGLHRVASADRDDEPASGTEIRHFGSPEGTFVIPPAKYLEAIPPTVDQVHLIESANAVKDYVKQGRAKGMVVMKVGLRSHGQLETVSFRRSSSCHTSCIAEDRGFLPRSSCRAHRHLVDRAAS